MAPAFTSRYVIGDIEVDASSRSVRRGGQEHFLRPKTFQVLLFLIENRDRAVSKDEILEAVWPGVAITEDTLVQSIVDIRKTVGDDSRDPWFIRTIPRRGYQLIAPVEIHGGLVARGETAPVTASMAVRETRSVAITVEETFDESPKDWRHFIPHVAIALVAIVLGTIAAVQLLREKPVAGTGTAAASSRRIPVAIAPFQNRTSSSDLEWLREGLPAMVLTQLATASDLTMIGGDVVQRHLQRKKTGAGAGDLAAWLEVAKEAGAERLIAGSFQRIGGQIRVDAQIHDVSTGRVAGGSSIVATDESLLSDVDVLTSKLAGALGSRLLIASNSRLSDLMTDDLEAYRLYTLGLQAANSLQNEKAIAYLEKAIERDPRFAMAYARIGYAYGVTWSRVDRALPNFAKALELGARMSERDRLYVLGWQAIAGADYPRAIDYFRLIVSRYPMEIEAYDRLGKLLVGEQRLNEAIDVLRRGLAIDRESPQIHNSIGGAYSYAGRHAEAISHHQRYVALSPNDPNAYDSLGLSYQWAGEYQKALAAYDDASRIDPKFEVAIVHRANTYWQLGRNREAIRELQRYIEVAPSPADERRGYGELTLIYRSLGDRARQEEMARRVTRVQPSMFIDAIGALDRGDVATAKRLLQSEQKVEAGRGARVFRRHEHFLAAEVARAEGDRSAALASARDAVRLLPPVYLTEDMEDVLADTYAAFAQWPEAIAEYGRVLRINPNRGRTRYKLARALESAGRASEARAEYQRFLQIWSAADSDAPEVADARVRLRRVSPSPVR